MFSVREVQMNRKPTDDVLETPVPELVRMIRTTRGQMSSRQREEGARPLLARLKRGRSHKGLGGVISLRFALVAPLALAGLILLGSVVLAIRQRAMAPLSYAIEGGRVGRSGLIESEPSSEPLLRFSDGSEVHIAGGAKASLQSVSGRGARVALASGSAHVDVAHRLGAEWLFDAGPFRITVTGTAFTFGWTANDEQLDVQMERGSVRVSGPLTDGELALRSGQHLIVRVRRRETIIRDLETDSASEPSAASVPKTSLPPPGSLPSETGSVAHPKRAVPGAGGGDWAALLASGDSEAVVLQAERRGLDGCLAEASAGDLAALADAARYGRHDDIARRVLLAERRRFALSGHARDAAFLLGRLEETGSGPLAALEWYDRYLIENPTGTYASEALGRKMILISKVREDDSARAVAQDYLNRFPAGTYAARARVLAGP
jgi:hypothetical protein